MKYRHCHRDESCAFIEYGDKKLHLLATQRRNLEKLSISTEAEKLCISLNLSAFITGQSDNICSHSSRYFLLQVSWLHYKPLLALLLLSLVFIGCNTTEADGVLLL